MKRVASGLIVLAILVAGCGGSSSSSSSSTATSSGASSGGGGGTQLKLSADPQKLAFSTKTLSAKAGKITISMENPSQFQHNIAIKGGANAQGAIVSNGGTSTVTITLKPGKYTFYCAVDGHEAAGMNGELDVN